ncbi:tRNA (adenosine(37)-N6)-dimethylallyltransferase MiaA [Ginsengibacter hankyongi]|uniref:tRNA dimethylallyltransferase n=1 Tax=Ginsengibacter hankyongi TaxID=2607284 RepID=A0A5J5IN09_9BACT|nr:tRNA (adenosine(37)-N6)-dimethylallyltransferase MiaA [Ginsengibacter hankyongi]KAA9041304.1 tRNA (adenosine(37)-N6)-dimethylallyltransferase MiaA [Ginsengibacter hankyongi]
MNRKTCIIISGPTAVGKTDFAIELAQKHQTQIISADSRQCYKELNIGVAKPSAEQLNIIQHYFISSHSIQEDVNVKVFEQYALNAVKKIFETNDVAVVVGGTGLYIKAFCEGVDDIPTVSEKIRNEIKEAYKKNGIEWLQKEIQKHDPFYFTSGEIQNPQRMMRALEVNLSTGNSILDFHSGKKIKRDFEIKKINLELPRNELYERINRRVDDMMNNGLLKEAENLFLYRHLNALQTVGYKELFDFIEGKISLDKAIDDIKKNTRHFAKRQVTWFKKFNE